MLQVSFLALLHIAPISYAGVSRILGHLRTSSWRSQIFTPQGGFALPAGTSSLLEDCGQDPWRLEMPRAIPSFNILS